VVWSSHLRNLFYAPSSSFFKLAFTTLAWVCLISRPQISTILAPLSLSRSVSSISQSRSRSLLLVDTGFSTPTGTSTGSGFGGGGGGGGGSTLGSDLGARLIISRRTAAKITAACSPSWMLGVPEYPPRIKGC